MARILYFSTHEPLEYDDIALFTGMGHTVFSLGVHCPAVENAKTYRPAIAYGSDVEALVELFHKEGCSAAFMNVQNTHLTSAFINAFDFIICVQDTGFVARYWNMAEKPVFVWRTVGQAIEHFDAVMEEYRNKGLKIVRWCARELQAPIYIGHDAIIRAYKDPDVYTSWSGDDSRVVTFCNHFKQRYPIEFGLLKRVLHDLPHAIGGAGNDDVEHATGLLSLDAMQRAIRGARAYFYCHGSTVPYTLNFIEAWMTGTPVIAAGQDVEIVDIDMRFNEINDFIIHGESGFLFRSEQQAHDIMQTLVHDRSYANAIGQAGRQKAIRIFGRDRAAADWQNFFNAFRGSPPDILHELPSQRIVRAQTQKEIAKVSETQSVSDLISSISWHQKWEIAPGVFTPGANPVDFLMKAAGVPDDLSGQRVLDIGAWNGCFSFEAERRGASVLAIGPESPDATGFSRIKAFLGSKVEYQLGTIYHLDPDVIGRFDTILCFGVVYHLRHILLAFDAMRRVCSNNLYIETASIDHNFLTYNVASDDPRPHILMAPEERSDIVSRPLAEIAPEVRNSSLMQFYRLDELAKDPTNWFAMNERCFRDVALSSGFRPRSVFHFGHRLAAACTIVPGYPEWIGNSGEGVYYDTITKPILGPRDVY